MPDGSTETRARSSSESYSAITGTCDLHGCPNLASVDMWSCGACLACWCQHLER